MPANAVTSRESARPIAAELLATKLTPPKVRPGYIPRPRLMAALAAARELRLTLVDAPTGYGKTMLLAAWCAAVPASDERATAWVSLGTTENDPALLTRYLIAALSAAGDAIGARAHEMLKVPGASPSAWMASLANDLAAAGRPTTLVLDDYHVVTEPSCHAVVQFLLDYAPASLHLIICTRARPPLTLGSLRAAAQLAELRTGDLRFTVPEAAALLAETDELDLDINVVESLATRTEGWGAGLYLAAMWLRGGGAAELDVARFTGDHRHLVDYLSEAVLGRLRTDVREFLLRTSIAERLCASLCEAITIAQPAACLRRSSAQICFSCRLMSTARGTATTISFARCC